MYDDLHFIIILMREGQFSDALTRLLIFRIEAFLNRPIFLNIDNVCKVLQWSLILVYETYAACYDCNRASTPTWFLVEFNIKFNSQFCDKKYSDVIFYCSF